MMGLYLLIPAFPASGQVYAGQSKRAITQNFAVRVTVGYRD